MAVYLQEGVRGVLQQEQFGCTFLPGFHLGHQILQTSQGLQQDGDAFCLED